MGSVEDVQGAECADFAEVIDDMEHMDSGKCMDDIHYIDFCSPTSCCLCCPRHPCMYMWYVYGMPYKQGGLEVTAIGWVSITWLLQDLERRD